MSGCAFWISAERAADQAFAERALDRRRQAAWCRSCSVGTTLSSIAWKIDGTPAMHMHVADAKARRDRDRIVDVLGAARHARHALARLGELDAALGVALLEQRHTPWRRIRTARRTPWRLHPP